MIGAPKLDHDKVDQIAALPLGSHLRTDPWDDRVHQLTVKPIPLLNARDKMPLEADSDHSQAVALHSTELTIPANEVATVAPRRTASKSRDDPWESRSLTGGPFKLPLA